jgi:hypothetical protein
MRSLLRCAFLAALVLVACWGIPGCSSQPETDTGKAGAAMDKMDTGKMSDAKDKMDTGKMPGAMGKMDAGKMAPEKK